MTREVSKRTDDLTHQIHRECLSRCSEQVKTLAPILICSMKIFIQLFHQGETRGENLIFLLTFYSRKFGVFFSRSPPPLRVKVKKKAKDKRAKGGRLAVKEEEEEGKV